MNFGYLDDLFIYVELSLGEIAKIQDISTIGRTKKDETINKTKK